MHFSQVQLPASQVTRRRLAVTTPADLVPALGPSAYATLTGLKLTVSDLLLLLLLRLLLLLVL